MEGVEWSEGVSAVHHRDVDNANAFLFLRFPPAHARSRRCAASPSLKIFFISVLIRPVLISVAYSAPQKVVPGCVNSPPPLPSPPARENRGCVTDRKPFRGGALSLGNANAPPTSARNDEDDIFTCVRVAVRPSVRASCLSAMSQICSSFLSESRGSFFARKSRWFLRRGSLLRTSSGPTRSGHVEAERENEASERALRPPSFLITLGPLISVDEVFCASPPPVTPSHHHHHSPEYLRLFLSCLSLSLSSEGPEIGLAIM